MALVLLIGTRAVIEIITGPANDVAILFGARQLGEFLVVLLAVGILRPSVDWFLGTARMVLPVMVACSILAIAQPMLGAGFYDQVFHGPGERLHHSYLVNIGDARRFRAVGTFIAPNELGLGLLVNGLVFVAPLLAAIARWRLVAVALMLMLLALVMSFSRSAWIGLALGIVATIILVRHDVARLLRAGMLFRTPLREVVLGLVAAAAATAALFVLVGGLSLLAGTVSGSESSAAGRGESISGGIEATFQNPGGLGLGTAGPRALELTGSSVLTENWYLLYSIQLGLPALVLLVGFAGAALLSVVRALRRRLDQFAPPWTDYRMTRYQGSVMAGTVAALIAALVGAMVIPALLDIPASVALWSSVAAVIGWALPNTKIEPFESPQ
jgi:O-antigen ligase